MLYLNLPAKTGPVSSPVKNLIGKETAMPSKEDIIIRKSILHVLDTNCGDCVLSDRLLDPGPDLYEFIRNHIYRIFSSDDTKDCEFNKEASPVYSILSEWDEEDSDSFITASHAIANKLYVSMGECLDVPPADLLFVSFQAEGKKYLALLKMNYRESYTHEVSVEESLPGEEETSSGTRPDETGDPALLPASPMIHAGIVKSKSLLPAATMRLPEAMVIDLESFHIKLLEKRYEFNGEKINYLSERFLVCNTDIAPKQKLKILTKVINDISNKYDGADFKVKMDTKSALEHEYIEQKAFDVEEIGQKLFGTSPEKKSEFDESMEKYNLQFDRFSVINDNTLKKLQKQVLLTDTGIEISVPMETYNKLADFEVQTDASGKTRIIISNINDLILK